VFKWKNYWEVKRVSIVLKPGQKVTRRMSANREVQLELLPAEKLVMRIYKDGKLTRCRTQPAEATFCIAGGDFMKDQSWFMVVRSDPPAQLTNN
jgi:hypothetical protein